MTNVPPKKSSWTSKPPQVPPNETIVKHADAWKAYAEAILEIISHDKYLKEEAELDAEIAEYAHEGESTRKERYYGSDNWVFVPGEADGCDVNCLGDDCWWTGNSDRIKEYNGSYRMLGTRNLYLCEICLHHRRDPTHNEDTALYEDLEDDEEDDKDDE